MDKLVAGARRLGIELNSDQKGRFGLYCREMLAWNERVNLTAIVDPEEVEVRHFLDSLTVARAFKGEQPRYEDVLDIGTGAGFPGIPLKLVFPEMRLTLVEATTKKARFLSHIADALAMPDVRVFAQRAEDLAHDSRHREAYDIVLARAVAPMPVLAELTLPFCRLGGVVIAQKKGDIEEELKQAGLAVKTMGGEMEQPIPVVVPEIGEDGRCLVLLRKIAVTPESYPRSPGIPAKRPLLGRAQG